MQEARRIEDAQAEVHQNLEKTVSKHWRSEFRKPIAQHNQQAFDQAEDWLAAQNKPLILDSFCGLGESTAALAERFPEHAIIGIDKSAHRLEKHQAKDRDNYLLVRADTDDFWRLAAQAGWSPERHFLLYPNPWPKLGHLGRRVHGGASFPSLLALGGKLELRSNWPIYVEEFSTALGLLGQQANWSIYQPEPCITAFERKYHLSGQDLYRCQCAIIEALLPTA